MLILFLMLSTAHPITNNNRLLKRRRWTIKDFVSAPELPSLVAHTYISFWNFPKGKEEKGVTIRSLCAPVLISLLTRLCSKTGCQGEGEQQGKGKWTNIFQKSFRTSLAHTSIVTGCESEWDKGEWRDKGEWIRSSCFRVVIPVSHISYISLCKMEAGKRGVNMNFIL